jgi:hypothetical protein
MRLGLGLFAIAVSTLALAQGGASAATRALVVGVSGYPNLAETLRLKGPRNDSREVARTIVDLGIEPASVTVLADGVADLPAGVVAPGPGTRSAILGQLERLEAESKPGDLVFFYFSGHGSQQPDRDGDEQGGNDEIFLPYDVGGWSGEGVENAIVDDDFDAVIRRILDKGVDFFGMIDACNSATGFRAAPDATAQSRQVPPDLLGVPGAGARSSRGLLAQDKADAAARGRAAFFYAAQETEEALELTPKGAEPGEFYGVFTYNVLKRMRQSPNLTYRTLHQAVVNDIKRGSLMATQTPELEGRLLDEPVLRLGDAAPRRQWPIWSGKLQGGELDGVSRGAVVALFDDPAAPDGEAIAYGRVEAAGATKSVVVPAAWPCGAGGADCAAADEAAFRKGRFARLVEPSLDFSLTLSPPVRIDPGDGHDYAAVLAAFDAAIGSDRLKARVSTRPAGYDVAVGLVDGKLAFSSAAGLVDPLGPGSSPRLTLPAEPGAARAAVEDAVGRIARALALQRLAVAGPAAGAALDVDIRIARARPGTVRDGVCPEGADDYLPPEPAGDAPQFDDCDILSAVMRNTGKKPIDVTALLIGPDFSITPVWPADGAANRIHLGEEKTADLLQMEPDPTASTEERLVFIAVPGVGKSHTVFDDLGQEGLRAGPPDLSPEAAALRALLATGLDDFSRSAAPQPTRIEEDMTIAVKPFVVRARAGG